MQFRLPRIRRLAIWLPGILLLAALMLFGSGSAFAAGGPGGGVSTASVAGTTLTESSDFSSASVSFTLNGNDQNQPYSVPAVVSDFTGTGAGWHYQEAATPLTDGSGHNLIQTITGVTSVACDPQGGHCALPTNSVSYPLNMDSTPRSFYNAALHTGLGMIDLTPTMNVALPASAYAGTYTSTVTFSIVTGP